MTDEINFVPFKSGTFLKSYFTCNLDLSLLIPQSSALSLQKCLTGCPPFYGILRALARLPLFHFFQRSNQRRKKPQTPLKITKNILKKCFQIFILVNKKLVDTFI